LPFTATLAAGSWTKQITFGSIAWGTASKLFGNPILNSYATATANTAGHRAAMYLTLPSGFGTTFQVEYIALTCKFAAAAGSLKFAIWATDGTVMASQTLDADLANAPTNFRHARVYFPTPATLNYGTKYYYGVEVVSGSVGVGGITCDSAEDIATLPMGANAGLGTFDGSNWTDSALTYPFVEIGFADITVPSGDGGGGGYVIGS
jgi:hypothetical protein